MSGWAKRNIFQLYLLQFFVVLCLTLFYSIINCNLHDISTTSFKRLLNSISNFLIKNLVTYGNAAVSSMT